VTETGTSPVFSCTAEPAAPIFFFRVFIVICRQVFVENALGYPFAFL
jgi:hypothetical protein